MLAVVAPRFSDPLSQTWCHPSTKNPCGNTRRNTTLKTSGEKQLKARKRETKKREREREGERDRGEGERERVTMRGEERSGAEWRGEESGGD